MDPLDRRTAGRRQGPGRLSSPPTPVVAAVALMIPVTLACAVGPGVFFLNALRGDDRVGLFLFGVPVLLLGIALTIGGVTGMLAVLRGRRPGCLLAPGIAVAILDGILVFGVFRSQFAGARTGTRDPIELQPSMLVPIGLLLLFVAAWILLGRPASRTWIEQPRTVPPAGV